jgi:cell division protein FtsB
MQCATRAAYRTRRRVVTGLAVGLALVFGYHAIFGQNGITAYAQKRNEDRVLAAEIEKLQSENAELKQRVDHLQSDPDAIEREARDRLHYTRPDEVIYTLDDRVPVDSSKPDISGQRRQESGKSPAETSRTP